MIIDEALIRKVRRRCREFTSGPCDVCGGRLFYGWKKTCLKDYDSSTITLLIRINCADCRFSEQEPLVGNITDTLNKIAHRFENEGTFRAMFSLLTGKLCPVCGEVGVRGRRSRAVIRGRFPWDKKSARRVRLACNNCSAFGTGIDRQENLFALNAAWEDLYNYPKRVADRLRGCEVL